ncbi:hypothetical protein V7793_05280 [Streptomyces sp. KLMMK]|uniref:hypothetical protein n=1 Tax=Streptomyces sp. KLMMK TaxID=3109353 RepID=UPI002FFF6E3E
MLDTTDDVREPGQASLDMNSVVMLLAPFVSPKTTAGSGGDTPVMTAPRLRVVAETANNTVLPATHSDRPPA